MSATSPVNTTVFDPFPLVTLAVLEEVVRNVSLPCAADRVIVVVAALRSCGSVLSGSVILM